MKAVNGHLILPAFVLFTAGMLVSTLVGISMIIPLAAGLVLFSFLALSGGFTYKELWAMILGSVKDSFIVIGILLLVGCLTGLWRASGTIAYFVTIGIKIVPKSLFFLAAYLLASAMSFAFGTSFGVTATAGVILITIARTCGADPVLTAGAILSGVYVGDRGSPASSAGNLVAVMTHTDMRSNVRQMLKTSIVPFLVAAGIYAVLSVRNPMGSIESSVLDELENEFRMGWVCLIPALLMLVLPFCGMKIQLSMVVSIAASVAVCLFWQHVPVTVCIRALVLGFESENTELSSMLSGGGIRSMFEVCVILLISGAYGGIFKNTGMLNGLDTWLRKLAEKANRFTAMLLISIGVSAVFCNQTIGIIMQTQLSTGLYGGSPEECNQKMLDTENTVVTVAGLIPWCIACSVPLSMLGATSASVPLAFFLWLVPLYNWILSFIPSGRQTQNNKKVEEFI